jgi:hypothetical protein
MSIIKKQQNINIDINNGISIPIIHNTYKYDDTIKKIIISLGNNKLTKNNYIIDIIDIHTDNNFFIVEINIICHYINIYIHNKTKNLYNHFYIIPNKNITVIDNHIDINKIIQINELENIIQKLYNLPDNYPNKNNIINKLNTININDLTIHKIIYIIENLKKQFIFL